MSGPASVSYTGPSAGVCDYISPNLWSLRWQGEREKNKKLRDRVSADDLTAMRWLPYMKHLHLIMWAHTSMRACCRLNTQTERNRSHPLDTVNVHMDKKAPGNESKIYWYLPFLVSGLQVLSLMSSGLRIPPIHWADLFVWDGDMKK